MLPSAITPTYLLRLMLRLNHIWPSPTCNTTNRLYRLNCFKKFRI